MQRHSTVSKSLMRRLGLALAGAFLAGVAGCGGGTTACHECVINPISGTDLGSMEIPAGGAVGVGVIGGVAYVVETSASNPMPVAGATITLWSGGSLGTAVMYTDVNGTVPAGGTAFLQLKTDDHGMVRVYPSANIAGCGGATKDITGSWGVTAATSNDQKVSSMSVTVKCAP